ncbi:MAG: C39 family peptidase, partial [Candidatus Tectimicrobiota bacterium]
RLQLPITSYKPLRARRLVRQAYDYSCGAAAIATLLTYVLQDPITEAEVLQQALSVLSEDEEALRKKEGLSLLDLQQIAQARGHRAQGFRLAPSFLPRLHGPVMVFIKPQHYEHFAVLHGVRGDRVFLADPSRGNIRLPLYAFLDMWLDNTGQGIIFVIERTDGRSPVILPLPAHLAGQARPELLSVRQLLEVGTPAVRFPHLAR